MNALAITRKQEVAIVALLSSSKRAEAATKAGVSEATLRRWLTQPNFREAYGLARLRAFDEAMTLLQDSAKEAAETLRACLQAPRPIDKIRAALAILRHAKDSAGLHEAVERIEAAVRQIQLVKSEVTADLEEQELLLPPT